MQLEHLCDINLICEMSSGNGRNFFLIRSQQNRQESDGCEQNGVVVGAKLRGKIRWVNLSRQCGSTAPSEIHGLIQTDDGAPVIFTMCCSNLSVELFDERPLIRAVFEADDERYRWLNNTPCVLDGVVDLTASTIRAQIYTCAHESV
jgi:hypothetical protein